MGIHNPTRDVRHGEAAGARPCPVGCPHPSGVHREYFAGNDDAGMPADPRYRPGLFACRVDGCDCEIDAE